MIDTVTRWFKITQYDDKIVISIMNLVGFNILYQWKSRMTKDKNSLFMSSENP